MATTRRVVPPNLPTVPRTYDPRFVDQLLNILRLFFNAVVNKVNAPTPHGSFYSTEIQDNLAPVAIRRMRLDRTVSAHSTYVGTPNSRVYVTETGVYNIQFSAQLDKSGGSASSVFIWLAVNGSSVPFTSTKIVIDGPNSEIVPAWNFVVQLSDGDYFEILWYSTDTNVILSEEPATANYPEIPSVILTVSWVSGLSA